MSAAQDTPILPPPHINIPHLANLRDVAKSLPPPSKATDASIQPLLLLRSADPSHVDDNGIALLHNTYHLRKIFDLRSEPEAANSDTEEFEDRIAAFNASHDAAACEVCKLNPGAPPLIRLWRPVFPAETYTPENLALRFANYGSKDPAAGFAKAYGEILASGVPSYAEIVQYISTPNVGSTLLHCTAGKDRTGVIVALILSILGISPDRIAGDYSLTEVGLAHKRDGMVSRLAATGAFGEDEQAALAAAKRMGGAKQESMIATLNLIGEKYGGADGYLIKECGLDNATLVALRKRFLTGEGSGAGGQAVL